LILKIAKLENNIHFNSHFNSQTGGGAFTRFNGLGAKKSKPKPKTERISTPVNNKKETTTTRPPPLSTTLTPSSIFFKLFCFVPVFILLFFFQFFGIYIYL